MTNTTTADLLNPLAKIKPYAEADRARNEFHPQFTFWNIDTQFDFMRKGNELGIPNEYAGKLVVEGAYTIEPKLEQLTKLAARRNIQVINTADWHRADSAELAKNPDFVNTYPEHCMMLTKGAEYVPATKPEFPMYIDWQEDRTAFLGDGLQRAKNIVLLKDKFDVFAGNKYADQVACAVMTQPNPDGVGTTNKRAVVYGVATNVCVDYAVMGLRERGYNVTVPTDAIKHLPHLEATPTLNLQAILTKWQNAGVALTTTSGIEALLKEN